MGIDISLKVHLQYKETNQKIQNHKHRNEAYNHKLYENRYR
jgi:hypothetical protein